MIQVIRSRHSISSASVAEFYCDTQAFFRAYEVHGVPDAKHRIALLGFRYVTTYTKKSGVFWKTINIDHNPPNNARTRQVGFASPNGVDSVLEHFPSNQRHLTRR